MDGGELLLRTVLCGMAAWRLASLLVFEAGPFDIFERLRARVGLDPASPMIVGFLPGLFSCIWCMSVWCVPLFWAIWVLSPECVGIVAAMSVALLTERARA